MFRSLFRSMLVQMLVPGALFLCGGLWLLALRPLLDAPPPPRRDARAETAARIGAALAAAVAAGGTPAALERRIADDPVIQQVQRRNPGFRYFALSGPARVGTAAPRYHAALGLDRITRQRAAIGAHPLCARLYETIPAAAGLDAIGYMDCGTPRYYEARGIAVPIDGVAPPGRFAAIVRRLWADGGGFVAAAGGMLALCIAVLLFHAVRIRRAARVGDAAGELPERGVPAEALPLVRAANRMIAGLTAGEERRRFFLSAAAHEMRTPLTVLRTRLELLDEGEAKTRLIGDVRRLTRLVVNLLTLTRIGTRPPAFADVDPAVLCRKVLDALDVVAIRRGVTLRLESATAPPPVRGDAALLEIAVTNLVHNAIAASPAGAAVCVAVAANGDVTVRDRGPGIAPERRAAIFEPFVRFSDDPSGHGLGLAIVRAVADVHGARIDVATAEGGGGSFAIRFADRPDAGRKA